MKTTKKTDTGASSSANSDVTTGIGKADPVPTVGAPPAPEDYVKAKATPGAKIQPPNAVIKAAAGAAKELESSSSYVADFGSSAPDPKTLGTTLAFAAAWSSHYALAEAWFAYVKEQTRLAWLQANPQLDDLGPTFAYAREHNDTIGTQYASTAKLFDARREPSVKAAAVRASKKATAKAAKKAAATGVAMPAAGSSLKN
jgi:hypothetical protein